MLGHLRVSPHSWKNFVKLPQQFLFLVPLSFLRITHAFHVKMWALFMINEEKCSSNQIDQYLVITELI